jgi:hypothetical protein
MTTECTGTIGRDGRCLGCGAVVFPHIWNRVQRKLAKPAKRSGLLPVGIRRQAVAK